MTKLTARQKHELNGADKLAVKILKLTRAYEKHSPATALDFRATVEAHLLLAKNGLTGDIEP